jgi:hypothetical protein
MTTLQKTRPGDYVLCMWPKNFEWRAYRVRSIVGGEKESFRSDLEFRPQTSAWASESVMVRTAECSVRNFGQIESGETPDEMNVILKEVSAALTNMRDEQKRARDRYVVLVSLLLPPPQ